MKNWTQIYIRGEDEDCYIRQVGEGRWFYISCIDIHSATGDKTGERYLSEVKYLNLTDIPQEQIDKAVIGNEEYAFDEAGIVEACLSYGFGAPLDQFGDKYYAVRAMAKARRKAESYIKYPLDLEEALDKPCNKIGSTAREYGRGDTMSALYRADPSDKMCNIIKKMHGIVT
jgi:hypothetical protein